MLAHVVMWKIKEEFKKDENKIKETIKKELEALKESIFEIHKIIVHIDKIDSSTHDLVLYSEFEDEKSLKNYASCEKHLNVVKAHILPYVSDRECIDYFI